MYAIPMALFKLATYFVYVCIILKIEKAKRCILHENWQIFILILHHTLPSYIEIVNLQHCCQFNDFPIYLFFGYIFM